MAVVQMDLLLLDSDIFSRGLGYVSEEGRIRITQPYEEESMSEAPATRQQLQSAVEDLQSEIRNESAVLTDLMTKLGDLQQAVKDAENLSHDMHDDIEWLRTSLGKVIELVRHHSEMHQTTGKILVYILNNLNSEERRRS